MKPTKKRVSDKQGGYICTPKVIQEKRQEVEAIILQVLGFPQGKITDHHEEIITPIMQQKIAGCLKLTIRLRPNITVGEFFNLFKPISSG